MSTNKGFRPRKQYSHGSVVVEILDDWLESRPEFSNFEVAQRIGVKKSASCFISQIRAGRSKLPVSKIIPLSEVLEKDPKPLVKAAMAEYYPELMEVLEAADLLKEQDSPKNLRNVQSEQKQAV